MRDVSYHAFTNTWAATKCYIRPIYFKYISHVWHTCKKYVKYTLYTRVTCMLQCHIQLFSCGTWHTSVLTVLCTGQHDYYKVVKDLLQILAQCRLWQCRIDTQCQTLLCTGKLVEYLLELSSQCVTHIPTHIYIYATGNLNEAWEYTCSSYVNYMYPSARSTLPWSSQPVEIAYMTFQSTILCTQPRTTGHLRPRVSRKLGYKFT